MMSKVAKFGGTSLADGNQFKKIKKIVLNDSEIICVIPSAPGKRFSGDIKVTDMLYECYYRSKVEKEFAIDYFKEIEECYDSIISELTMELNLSNEYDKIIKKIRAGITKDYLVSRGEYLSGLILSNYLGYKFIDPFDYIIFDKMDNLDEKMTYSNLKSLKNEVQIVIPGFYGKDCNGEVKTFPRGGSDITGAIVSNGLSVDIYENWTDVSGVYVIDPRLVNKPQVRKYISYKELNYMSVMGANVYHTDAIYPVMHANIPIHIRNTNDLLAPGTLIKDSNELNETLVILGITGRTGYKVYKRKLEVTAMSTEHRVVTKDFIAYEQKKDMYLLENENENENENGVNQTLILVVINPKYDKVSIYDKIETMLNERLDEYILSYSEYEENLLYMAVSRVDINELMSEIYYTFYS